MEVGTRRFARAWRRYYVKPWKRETFSFSPHPECWWTKVRDVIGWLYLKPPEQAVVLCFDEDSRIRPWIARH